MEKLVQFNLLGRSSIVYATLLGSSERAGRAAAVVLEDLVTCSGSIPEGFELDN